MFGTPLLSVDLSSKTSNATPGVELIGGKKMSNLILKLSSCLILKSGGNENLLALVSAQQYALS